MSKPLVSIIIPSYNSAQFLAEAIESVLNQNYDNWELIIVDDGSTDNIDVVVESFLRNEKVSYYKKENGGLSSARNFGIYQSKGSYILPLDADDKLHTNYISKAIAEFTKNENLKLVYSRAFYFETLNEEWFLNDYSYRLLLTENMIFCSAIFKKKDFNAIGGYRENLIFGREDWDFWLRLLDEKSEVFKIPEVLFYYRKHKGPSMSDKFNLNELNNSVLMDLYYFNKEIFMKYYGNPIFFINKFNDLENKYQKLKTKYDTLNNSLLNRIVKKVKHIFRNSTK